ncbi:MAG TPA: hypothetical protein VF868_16960 [Bacteroidia bacterium]|jgi:hypothetical protein
MKHQKFNNARLIKYAQHLQVHDLRCERFCKAIRKNKIVQETIGDKSLNPLCLQVVMELPLIFSEDWCYGKDYLPVLKKWPKENTTSAIIYFFGINTQILLHLFSPGNQRIEVYGGFVLQPRPTAMQLARNIFELIDIVRGYEDVVDNENQFSMN